MKTTIFIDGLEGTTGLKILERFKERDDIELIQIDGEKRKDAKERAKLINNSDYTFLCLPDAAAIESVGLCVNPHTKIIDASTAHRTHPEWTYGFPELDDYFYENIRTSKRVAVPGCYASGFNAIVYPLVKHAIVPRDYPLVAHAVSGYSGAGKKAIAQYEAESRPQELESPRLYALSQMHKHLPEMKKISGLETEPIFTPYICDFFQGMTVTIGLHSRLLSRKISAQQIRQKIAAHYEGKTFVKVMPFMGEGVLEEPFIAANTMAGTNTMHIFVYGNDERIILTSRFDNLGKGASGAAVQCLNIMMGIDETTRLL